MSTHQHPAVGNESCLLTLLTAVCHHVYRIEPDWSAARELSTLEPSDERPETHRWLEEYVYPEDRNEVAAEVAEGVRAKRVFEVEHRYLRADGSAGWMLSRFAPLVDETGAVLEWFGVSLDVTERRQGRLQVESEKQRLEVLLDAIPLGILLVQGPRGTISYVNQRARELYGFHSVGLTLEESTLLVKPRNSDGTPRPLSSLPSYRALQGESVRNEEMMLERPDGATYQVLASASPLPDTDTREPAAVEVFEDITERKQVEEALRRSEERLQRELRTTRTLVETARTIAEWADLQSVLHAITQAVIAATSHTRATVALWNDTRREVEIVHSAGDEPMPRLTAPVESFSPPFQRVAEYGQSMVADYDALPAEQTQMARAVGSRKALLVPFVARHRLVGGLFVDDPGKRGDFHAEEIRLIEGIADQATAAIENARLYETQSNIAATLQEALLELPAAVAGIRFSHLYRSATGAAAIGGDFYDLIPLEDGGHVLLIGDVSGHGIEAARSATFVRHAVAAFAAEDKDAQQILADTNRALMRRKVASFVSVLLAILSPDLRRLSFCSAGHPNFILRRRDGSTTLIGRENALPLGVFADWSCSLDEVELAPGDVILFYTDGLIEARRDREMFGENRLIESLRQAGAVPFAQLPSALLGEVLGFTRGTLQDDVAILAVEIAPET